MANRSAGFRCGLKAVQVTVLRTARHSKVPNAQVPLIAYAGQGLGKVVN
jgi:hypothetical protein